MQVENHKEEIPFSYYEGLFAKLEPQEASRRLTDIQWDGKEFYVNLLGRAYAIAHPVYAIRALDGGNVPPLPTQTFLLRYLLEGRTVAAVGNWLTFREMPWGELYIKPYTGRVLTRAAFTFGTRVASFAAAIEKLGARKLRHGDAGYEVELLPWYFMQILVWAGDEEFPPNSQILYSDNFAEGFSAEDRVVAGDILISVVKSCMYADDRDQWK